MRYPSTLRYLHEKSLPRYPLWNPGNPRHRLFLPLFWVKLIRKETENASPDNYVNFECHWQMTREDVKQYLEKLYNIDVTDVNIEIKPGGYMKHPAKANALSPPLPDRKYAYVQLRNSTFKFPDLIDKAKIDDESKLQKNTENQMIKEINRDRTRMGISSWFF
jgi:large subunit ribosomal protein L23